MYNPAFWRSSTKLGPGFLHISNERIVRPTPILEMPGLKVLGSYAFYDSYTLNWHHHEYYELCFVEEGEVAWEFSVTPPRLIHKRLDHIDSP